MKKVYSSIRHRIVRIMTMIGIITVIGVIVFLLVFPAGVYWYGLSLVHGKPCLSETILSQNLARQVWQQYQGKGNPRVRPLTPWHYYQIFYKAASVSQPYNLQTDYPGFIHASKIAQYYIHDQQRLSMLQWHISTAALGIWLTRHWTIEQILAKLQEYHVTSVAKPHGNDQS